jgi:hypothetical protein
MPYRIDIYFVNGGRCYEEVDTLKKAQDRVNEISVQGVSFDCPQGEFQHRPSGQINRIYVREVL